MKSLDNLLENLWEKTARSKYNHRICPKIAEMMLRRATRTFPHNNRLNVVMDTGVWILGEDLFTSLQASPLDEDWEKRFAGWRLVRAKRYIEREEHQKQAEYFAPIRNLIVTSKCVTIFSLPGINTEFCWRRRKGTWFGLDIWEGVKPSHLHFSRGMTLQSYLVSLGNERPKSAKNLPEYERLWFAFEGYTQTGVNSKCLFRKKLFERIYEEKWDDQYNRLVDALANAGNVKRQTQDAWHLRMLELEEFGIHYFLTLDTTLIRKVRASRKDGTFDRVRDKLVTPKEFCEKFRIKPVSIRYLSFDGAGYPVDLDSRVKVVNEKSSEASFKQGINWPP